MTPDPRLPIHPTSRLRRNRRPLVAFGAVDECERELAVIRDRRSWTD